MSRGVVDEEAVQAARRAMADAGKRGLRIVAMTVEGLPGEARRFSFGYEALPKRGRKAAETASTPVQSGPSPISAPPIRRGGVPRPVIRDLF